MDKRGHKFILVPYNLLIDTDVGLYKLLEKKYCNDKIFHIEPFTELDMPHLLYFLIDREFPNPLDAIAKEENKELMQEYYDQFFEREYDYILRRSITTTLYDFIKMVERDKDIHVSVWVPSENIKNILVERDQDGFGSVEFRITDTYPECVNKRDDPIYIKDIFDILRNIEPFLGKTMYVANYAFNYEINEITGRPGLKHEVGDIMSRRAHITTFDIYRETDIAKIEG